MTSAAAAAGAADETASQDKVSLAVVVTCFIIIFFTENLSDNLHRGLRPACLLDELYDFLRRHELLLQIHQSVVNIFKVLKFSSRLFFLSVFALKEESITSPAKLLVLKTL